MSNTIKLKNYLNIFEEYAAAAAITPGHLIELTSANKVQVHSDLDGFVLPMFAIEDDLQGKGIDDDYALNDRVQVWIPQRGDFVNAILFDGESVVIGDKVVSNGDGTLKKLDAVTSFGNDGTIIGVVVEATDMSGGASSDPVGGRVVVRIA